MIDGASLGSVECNGNEAIQAIHPLVIISVGYFRQKKKKFLVRFYISGVQWPELM